MIETHFENLSGRRPKLGGCLILFLFFRKVKYRARLGVLTVSDNKWSCGRTIFQGNRAIKTSKRSSLLGHNIVLEILEH